MTLDAAKTYNGLDVCPTCGWPMTHVGDEHRRNGGCPHQLAGHAATSLAARLPEVRSTKFGYGTGNLAFQIDRRLTIRFDCTGGAFDLRDVWLLGELDENQAVDLVRTIAEWRRRNK